MNNPKPVQNLPPNYKVAYSIDLSSNIKMTLWLNLAGLVILCLVFWLLVVYTNLVRTNLTSPSLSFTVTLASLVAILWVLLLIVGMLVVHEAIHGLFFWFFTHSRPVFGLGLSYAYAAAPDWYIPLRLYWIVGLAPLILIGLGGLLVIAFGPQSWVLPAMAVVGFNTGGAVGDIWIVGRMLLGGTGGSLVRDTGHSVTCYSPPGAE
jgi:hypothetical protein